MTVTIQSDNLLNWPVVPDHWQHQSKTIDVFAMDLNAPPIPLEQAHKHLSDLERQRVSRFKSPKAT